MILEENYILENGIHIPKLGLGTWFIPDATAAQAVRMPSRSATVTSTPLRLMRMNRVWEKASAPAALPGKSCS